MIFNHLVRGCLAFSGIRSRFLTKISAIFAFEIKCNFERVLTEQTKLNFSVNDLIDYFLMLFFLLPLKIDVESVSEILFKCVDYSRNDVENCNATIVVDEVNAP